MKRVFGAAVDARLQEQGMDLIPDIEAIKDNFAARGFSELPGIAIGEITDYCSTVMDKTLETALIVFGEQRGGLQVAEVEHLRMDLLTYLDSRLKSVSSTALSYVEHNRASETQRFQHKIEALTAAAHRAVGI